MGRFDGKVVIVTGSSSGIGQAVLLAFAKEGAKVVLHGTDAGRIKQTEELLVESGISTQNFLSICGDLLKDETHQKIIDDTVEKFGQIDVLVNNAGISGKFGTDPTSPENFDFVLDINFRAPYLLTQLALPHLQKTGGNVINTSSIISFSKPYETPNWAVYGAAKSALDTWTKFDAQRLAKFGVRINNINPGPFLTNQINKALPENLSEKEKQQLKEKKEKVISDHTVFKRFGKMEELTPTYLHLADNNTSSFTTGACWTVDGGMAFYAEE